ncbi:Longitudinals lacking protein, isoforms H/M/V [Orchesella cincta]|uniref:Longitudinals lacking protein, isoforms H/M/V n=1 Tax=Orchesella cincta TaxID=48709 RepID=A0A1D2NGP6_ORCCI|nr:Longitudinals lacking protein, isoforms H/M/V [Orchesella cincta]
MELQQLQHVQLRWTDHRTSTWSELEGLLRNENLVDITLAAEGRFMKAHKVVLSVCSPYFQELLSAPHKDKEPIIFLTNVTYAQLEAVLKYMYKGEVQLPQRDLMSFIHVAKALKIRGLSDLSPNEQEHNMQSNDFQDNSRSDCGRQDMGHGQNLGNQNHRRMEPNNSRVQPTVPSSMNTAADVGMGMQNQSSISPVSVFSSTSASLQKATDQSTDDIFASFHHADASVNFASAVDTSLPSTSSVTNHLQSVTSSAAFIHSSAPPDLMNTDQSNQFQISQFELMSTKREATQDVQHTEDDMLILPNVDNDPLDHNSTRQNGGPAGRLTNSKEKKQPKAKRFIHVPDGAVSRRSDGVYECPKCCRRYRHMASCQRHIKLECGKAPQFQCMNCGKKFKFRFRLANHYRICKRMNNYTGVDKFESGSVSQASTAT